MVEIHLNTRIPVISTRSFVPCNYICHFRICRRHQTSSLNPSSLISKHYICHFLGNQSLQSLSTGLRLQHDSNTNRDIAVCRSILPGATPLPSDPSPSSWKVWILGMLLTVILPFLGNKWGPLLKLKSKDLEDEVETAVETAEHVAEIVENVAEGVEKVAEEIADNLPGGKLKNAVIFVENVAREAAKDAHLAEEVIEKVEEVEKEVVSFMEPATEQTVESFMEPATEQAKEITKEATDQS